MEISKNIKSFDKFEGRYEYLQGQVDEILKEVPDLELLSDEKKLEIMIEYFELDNLRLSLKYKENIEVGIILRDIKDLENFLKLKWTEYLGKISEQNKIINKLRHNLKLINEWEKNKKNS